MIPTTDLAPTLGQAEQEEDAAGAAAVVVVVAVVVAVAVVAVVPVVVVVAPVGSAASVDLAAPGALLPLQPPPLPPLLTRPSCRDSKHNAPQDNKNHEELFPQS